MSRRARTANRPTAFHETMQAVLNELQPGEVVSYGDVAVRAGYPNAARAAGAALADCPETLPWWRVVYGDGHLPPCNPSLQAERLAAEGVVLKGFRVVTSPHGRFADKSAEAAHPSQVG